MKPISIHLQVNEPAVVAAIDLAPPASQVSDEVAGPDPVIGRYKLSESEGFDEYMKCLGVSMMRRRLASSVSPVIVVEISEDGTYTIRTETRVTTSEIRDELIDSDFSISHQIRHGLVARIAGSHPAGPGSIPGAGNMFLAHLQNVFSSI